MRTGKRKQWMPLQIAGKTSSGQFAISIIVACFIPAAQPYLSDGFKFLREDCPDWLSWGILASIGASFGLKSIGQFKK